ncbi:hypothetical protein, partial [Streptococcus anginosus]|uniref:hypothetical protein n=1 Tax=Streptococcus anginosus TaxID=1328 RepID=UPI002ED903CC
IHFGSSSMVGCKYLHLSQSATGRATQRTAMLGSCLLAQHATSNSVQFWFHFFRPQAVWVNLSLLHFCPCISFRQEQFLAGLFLITTNFLAPADLHQLSQ